MTEKTRQRLDHLDRAIERLGEALAVPRHAPLAIDGTIRRFEFSFELAWKAAKAVLEDEGIQARSPRETFREAMRAGWLEDEGAWLDMLHDRNLSSHTYDAALADEVYDRIQTNAPALRALYARLVARAETL